MKTRSMKKAVKIRALKLLHLIVAVGMFIACWQVFYYGKYAVKQHLKGDLILYALYAVLLFLMNRTYDAYSLGYRKASDNTYSQVLSQVITAGIIWIVSLLMYMQPTNPLPLIGLCAVQLLWDMLWSVTAKKAYDALHMHCGGPEADVRDGSSFVHQRVNRRHRSRKSYGESINAHDVFAKPMGSWTGCVEQAIQSPWKVSPRAVILHN